MHLSGGAALVKGEDGERARGEGGFRKTKHTPDETKDKLNGSVSLMLPIKTYGDRALGYHNSSNVVGNGDRRKLGSKDKLEDVHRNEELIPDEEECNLVEQLRSKHGRLGEIGRAHV